MFLLAAGMVNVAVAEGLPSSKATFAYNQVIALPNSSCPTNTTCSAVSAWTPILRQQIKMANQKDLFINASLQCGIVTDTTVKSLSVDDSVDSALARATIRVRVKITGPNGVSYAQPSAGVDATNTPDVVTTPPAGVVFCDRIQELKAKFAGLNCTANLTTGEVICANPEELELILKTLNANAFNFVAPNLVSGEHTIDVEARTSANVSTTGTNGSLGNANAFIGAGSVAIESVRMIKGNTGVTLEIN
jgi:hypothetical protein